MPFWDLLMTLFKSQVETPNQLVELLETIAVTLRGNSEPAGDYHLLKSFISDSLPEFFNTHWPSIIQLARDLPRQFPSSSLPVLGLEASGSTLRLSRRQTACLLVHQFLCTLRPPVWRENYFDFSIWYASGQRHEQACRTYLTCFFTYLETFDSQPKGPPDDWFVTYTLVTSEKDYAALSSSSVPLGSIEIAFVDSYQTNATQLGLPSGAAVVAANRYIGFGQSATQEEVHVGSSPEACPAVLITPPLESNQVLVVRGAQSVLNIIGERRNITAAAQEVGKSPDWRQRAMLFMDALELDAAANETGLPDLVPENLSREINKAAIAFSSGVYDVVFAPQWGCGAFGGDPFVKMMLLWCAASIAKTPLKILCDQGSREVASSLNSLISAAKGRLKTAQELVSLLQSIPRRTARLATIDRMMELLEKEGLERHKASQQGT